MNIKFKDNIDEELGIKKIKSALDNYIETELTTREIYKQVKYFISLKEFNRIIKESKAIERKKDKSWSQLKKKIKASGPAVLY